MFFNQLARERFRAFANADPPAREARFEGTMECNLSGPPLFKPTDKFSPQFFKVPDFSNQFSFPRRFEKSSFLGSCL